MTASSNNGQHGSGGGRDACHIEPMPPDLYDTPLEFFFADHFRHRQASAALRAVADGNSDGDCLDALKAFLSIDYRQHMEDEELSFYPLLRKRCRPEDQIEETLARLKTEHRDEEGSLVQVLHDLDAIAAGHPISDAMSARLRSFAEHMHQHLAVENCVVLPIARVRLSDRDLQTLAAAIKSRRRV